MQFDWVATTSGAKNTRTREITQVLIQQKLTGADRYGIVLSGTGLTAFPALRHTPLLSTSSGRWVAGFSNEIFLSRFLTSEP